MAGKKTEITIEDRVAKLEQEMDATKQRCLQLERAIRVIGLEFQKTHLSEDVAKEWARRVNYLDNAMREIRLHLSRHGNQFDKSPHFVHPEDGWQE